MGENDLPAGWERLDSDARSSTIAHFVTGFTDGSTEVQVWRAPFGGGPEHLTTHLDGTEVTEGDEYIVEVHAEGDAPSLEDEIPCETREDAVNAAVSRVKGLAEA